MKVERNFYKHACLVKKFFMKFFLPLASGKNSIYFRVYCAEMRGGVYYGQEKSEKESS